MENNYHELNNYYILGTMPSAFSYLTFISASQCAHFVVEETELSPVICYFF